MNNISIEDRIKELRWKNELFYKRLFTRKDSYIPSEINIDAKIKQEKNAITFIRLLAFAIAIIFGFIADDNTDRVKVIYQMLFAFLLFLIPSFTTRMRLNRFEEIRFLTGLLGEK